MKRLLPLLPLLLIVPGCTPKPGLVGKWTGSFFYQNQQVPATMEIKADNTFTIVSEQSGLGFIMSGPYENNAKDSKVVLTIEEFKLSGELPKEAQAYKPMIEQQMAAAKGQKTEFTYALKDADTLDVKYTGGAETTFKRAKEGK